MPSTFVGNIAGKGKKAPSGGGGERGAARRGGGGAAAGKESPEKQAVMRMQNLLNTLSRELDTNQKNVVSLLSTKEKPVDEPTIKGWSGVLADTGIPGRGTASNDGIWGGKTQKACRAAEEIAKLVRARGRKIPEIVDGPTYKQTDSKTLIANSEKNIAALVSLMRALGLAVPAEMAGTQAMLDKVPINLQQENVDPRTVKPDQAAYPLTVGNLRDLRSAYAWLMGLFGGGSAGIQFEPLKPVEAKSPEQLRKLAQEIRNSLIVRLGQPTSGPPTPEGRDKMLAAEQARKARQPGARGPNAGPRPEDLPKPGYRGPAGQPAPTYEGKAQGQPAQAKPAEKPKTYSDLTVAQFENGLRWIQQRAYKTYLLVNDAARTGEKLAFKGDQEITAVDVQMARYYAMLAGRLMQMWQREKLAFRPKDAKKGWEQNTYIDPSLLGMGAGAGGEWGASRRSGRSGREGGGGYGGYGGTRGRSSKGPITNSMYIPNFRELLSDAQYSQLAGDTQGGRVILTQWERMNPWDLAPTYSKRQFRDDRYLAKWFYGFANRLGRALNSIYNDWETRMEEYQDYPQINEEITRQRRLLGAWQTAINQQKDRANSWMRSNKG